MSRTVFDKVEIAGEQGEALARVGRSGIGLRADSSAKFLR
jgi:hypothetical protein